jgi:lauroyl/myristoyl acyltransferase
VKQPQLIERIQVMEENIFRREKRKLDQAFSKDYSFVSANLSNFLPELPFEKHEEFYLDTMQHRSLAVFHSDLTQLVHRVKAIGDLSFLDRIATEPFIFCNYHLGSYRALLGFLVSRQIDFAMLLDGRTFTEQGEKINQSIDSLMLHSGKTISFKMFNVEDATSMMQIGQWLRSGKSLVAYLDGNTGYGGIYNNSKEIFLKLDFMGMPLRNRKGISSLSWFTKTPIIPAISYFINKEDAPLLEFFPSITPVAPAQKDNYVLDTTQHLYKILESKLRDYPSQWEPWLYIHKFLDIERLREIRKRTGTPYADSLNSFTEFSFNRNKYSLFRLDDHSHLLDRLLYKTYELTPDVFSTLKECYDQGSFTSLATGMTDSFVKQLLDLEVIQAINHTN